MPENKKYGYVPVSVNTKDRIDAMGKKSETYDQILRRILDKAEASQ